MSAPEVIEPDSELARLIREFVSLGGVLDYVFLCYESDESPEAIHRSVALAGMAAIDRRLEEYALSMTAHAPIEHFFRVTWDATRLVGVPVPFEMFWGTDEADLGNVDGYRPAFFHTPHGIGGSEQEIQQLFASINVFVLGPDPRACEIFSWGTDWSNYFYAGKEWWGAFFWTLRQPGSDIFTVIGASTTD